MENILLEYKGAVAILKISRPKQLNVITMDTMRELEQTIDGLYAKGDVRCLVITGEGERSFVAGADTRELAALDEEGARSLSRDGNRVYTKIERFPAPVIMAVNGFAFGGGCELALCGDIRIASDNALFSLPETAIGVCPGWGGTQRLARLIGYGAAAQLIFSAARIDAQKALAIGLVGQVVERASLMDTALSIAEKIAENAPLSVRAAKEAMLAGLDERLADGLERETAGFAGLFAVEDTRRGLEAFNNKETYDYQGR